jgi:hypothetical protein
MARYYFDVHDGGTHQRDDTGTEFEDLEAVRKAAMRLLPEVARQDLASDGDRHTFMVLVTNEDGRPVYSATLSYAGLWLLR